jgi:hypothetical protein
MMKPHKAVFTILTAIIITLALVKIIQAQTESEMQTFFTVAYPGITLGMEATNETVPGGNATLKLWINCTASGVHVDHFNLSVYGFRLSGPQQVSLYTVNLIANQPLFFNQTSEYNCTISIPSDVYGPVYCELNIKYSVVDEPIQRSPGFPITFVRNVYYENLKEEFQRLSKDYQQLNDTYWQLNSSFLQLNQSYWALRQNYTSLQGSMNELDNARRLAVIMGITTAFFVVTTLYLVFRIPRNNW